MGGSGAGGICARQIHSAWYSSSVFPRAGHRADKGSHRILHGEKRRVARADGIGM